MKILKNLGVLSLISIYCYIIYKLIMLNWFVNAGFPTLVIITTLLVAFPIGLFKALSFINRK